MAVVTERTLTTGFHIPKRARKLHNGTNAKLKNGEARKMTSYTGYMCRTDFECERGDPIEGNRFFSSIVSLRNAYECVEDCGIVEVKISLVRVVTEGNDDD